MTNDHTVTFIPKRVAEALKTPSVLISIGDPDEPVFVSDVKHKAMLSLAFYDTEIHHRIDNLYKPFTLTDAACILEFIQQWVGHDIVVHCSAGLSRSAAVARFLNKYMGYRLVYHKLGSQTLEHHNRRVYEMLVIANRLPIDNNTVQKVSS